MSAQLELTWRGRAPTKCARLRLLLSDGLWHGSDEVRDAGGWRYNARLLELRCGQDGGPPLLIEKRQVGGDVSWEWRSIGVSERPHEPRSSAQVLFELRRENERLKRINAELERALITQAVRHG